MAILRAITASLLLVSVLVSSIGLASARGQAPAVDMIVICAGQGFATIAIDADGNPTHAPVLCPDGLMGFADTTAPQPNPAPVALQVAILRPVTPLGFAPAAQATGPLARGPPPSFVA
ncbi:hypothetical protein ACMU_10410 [Actibacterium mucosum KCTC 23349]|uniref:Secreted protein n=1 Tax=Actibacterium mucosum KCTC 23349 TaxID=1454373 RepID=A0A037ZI80_9RHOB|nr:hypothetical protein [Actibacterium mucosum]KAJ56155.1 hypothetical protein ACMU_10410 [Actibacterium mucosum KCTC 23349]